MAGHDYNIMESFHVHIMYFVIYENRCEHFYIKTLKLFQTVFRGVLSHLFAFTSRAVLQFTRELFHFLSDHNEILNIDR